MDVLRYGWLVRTAGRRYPRQFLVATVDKDSAVALIQRATGASEKLLSITRVDGTHFVRLGMAMGDLRELGAKGSKAKTRTT